LTTSANIVRLTAQATIATALRASWSLQVNPLGSSLNKQQYLNGKQHLDPVRSSEPVGSIIRQACVRFHRSPANFTP
jgi:hypothetical protein